MLDSMRECRLEQMLLNEKDGTRHHVLFQSALVELFACKYVLALKAKKLYLTISVMLHASNKETRFSSREYSPRGKTVTPLLLIWAGAANMMPHTIHILDATCMAAGQSASITLVWQHDWCRAHGLCWCRCLLAKMHQALGRYKVVL